MTYISLSELETTWRVKYYDISSCNLLHNHNNPLIISHAGRWHWQVISAMVFFGCLLCIGVSTSHTHTHARLHAHIHTDYHGHVWARVNNYIPWSDVDLTSYPRPNSKLAQVTSVKKRSHRSRLMKLKNKSNTEQHAVISEIDYHSYSR